jgi:hypothetical protein
MSEYDTAGAGAGEPMNDPMTEDMADIATDVRELLGASLAKRRDEWVSAKTSSGVEKRWTEDSEQYQGQDAHNRLGSGSMMETVENGGVPTNETTVKPTRSTVFVNITRPKTNAAEARMANMLLPTDDRNWGIKPTPVPKLVAAADEEAKQAAMQMAQAQQAQGPQAMLTNAPPVQNPQQQLAKTPGTASAQVEEANKRARAMQEKIDDQLTQCDYNAQIRAMFHDCAVLGTGILKGPIVVNRVRKAWKQVKDAQGNPAPGVYQLEIVEEKQPASVRVDPWDVYTDPACGASARNGSGIFERKLCTAKQLRELAKQPGYDEAQIAKVLEEGPRNTVTTQNARDAQKRAEAGAKPDDLYEVWEYWGEFTPEDLRAAGVDIKDGATGLVSGCVILVNQCVIKGFLNPLETGDLPYDFHVWERADGSVWGYGVPHLLKSQQRVLNAAWRQLMDNAGLSVGPQIVIDPSKIAPADQRMEITGRKIWYSTDPAADVNKIFAQFDIDMHADEFLKVIDMTMKFMDLESSTPELMQGEKGNAPETLGGMILLQNTSNVVLTRQVKGFDDDVTCPHIRRYYDWNMAYAPEDEIKGDFQIDARGSSVLLVRDIQNQALLQLGQFSGNGVIAPMVRWHDWFKEVLRAQRIEPSTIMKTDAEIAAAGAQPAQATPEQIRANATLQVAQKRADAAVRVADAKVHGELAYAEKMREIEQQNSESRRQERQDELQLELIKYANQNKLSLDSIRADLAKAAMQESTKRQLAEMSAQVRQNEHHSNLAFDAHKHHVDQVREVMQPAPQPDGGVAQ